MTRAIHAPMSEAQRRGMQLEAARLAAVASLTWLEREFMRTETVQGFRAASGIAAAIDAANASFDVAHKILEVSE